MPGIAAVHTSGAKTADTNVPVPIRRCSYLDNKPEQLPVLCLAKTLLYSKLDIRKCVECIVVVVTK